MAHERMHTAPQGAAQIPMSPQSLSAMVAARICHDLVSPLGAIGNGVELLQVTGSGGPELDLLAESTQNASARLRFFRVAFGIISADQMISRAEITSILTALNAHQKHTLAWRCEAELSRRQVKLVFLMLMCLETVLPWGGDIEIADHGNGVRLQARSERLKIDDDLWSALQSGQQITDLTSARIQFALALAEITAQHCRIEVQEHAGALMLNMQFA